MYSKRQTPQESKAILIQRYINVGSKVKMLAQCKSSSGCYHVFSVCAVSLKSIHEARGGGGGPSGISWKVLGEKSSIECNRMMRHSQRQGQHRNKHLKSTHLDLQCNVKVID